MTVVRGLQTWQLNFSIEVEDEDQANCMFDLISNTLSDAGKTQWSGKMYRDLDMERALEVFRQHKEEILSSLPVEVVQQFYPDSVPVSDEIAEKYAHLSPETQRSMQRKHNSLLPHLEVVPDLEEDYDE